MMENKVLVDQLMLTLTTVLCAYVNGECTLPKVLRGNWISSDDGGQVLNFTDNTIVDYQMVIFGVRRPMPLRCVGSRENMYMFKAPAEFLHQYLYTCLEFHAVSDVKMWYQQATEYSPSNRGRTKGVHVNSTATIESVCHRQRPYAASSFSSLLKEGSFDDGGYPGILCPSDLHQTFSQGTLHSSTTVPCGDNFFDVCGNQNRTQILLRYGSTCRSSLKKADGESYVCLWALTSPNGVTYLHLYNNVTKGINCLAFKATDTSLQGTLFPGSCWDNETDTYAGPGGIFMSFLNTTKTCKDIHVIKPSLIGLYAGIAAGVLVLILIVIGAVYCTYKTRCRFIKRLYKKTKIGNSEELLSSDSTISKGISVGTDSNNLTPVVIPELYPPTKVELLYQVESKWISGKKIFNSASLVPVMIPDMKGPPKVEPLYKVTSKTISKKVTFDPSLVTTDVRVKMNGHVKKQK